MKKQRGLTLIELMVAMVIVGILAMVAVPAYTGHITQSKIADVTGLLSEGKVRMEQTFNSQRSYYADASSGGTTCPDFSALFGDSAFTVATVCDSTTFTLTAKGSSTKGMDGYTYTINQSGEKTSKTPAVESSRSCWLKTKDQTSC